MCLFNFYKSKHSNNLILITVIYAVAAADAHQSELKPRLEPASPPAPAITPSPEISGPVQDETVTSEFREVRSRYSARVQSTLRLKQLTNRLAKKERESVANT